MRVGLVMGVVVGVGAMVGCASQRDAKSDASDAGLDAGPDASRDGSARDASASPIANGSGSWTWQGESYTADQPVVCEANPEGRWYTVSAEQADVKTRLVAVFGGARPPAAGSYACVSSASMSALQPGEVFVELLDLRNPLESAVCDAGTVTVDEEGGWNAMDLPLVTYPDEPAGTLNATVHCP